MSVERTATALLEDTVQLRREEWMEEIRRLRAEQGADESEITMRTDQHGLEHHEINE